MQNSSQTAVRFEPPVEGIGENLCFAGKEAKKLYPLVSAGSHLELLFHAGDGPALWIFTDLYRGGAFGKMNEFTSRSITAMASSTDHSRQSNRTFVVELSEAFFDSMSHRNNFFIRLCPQLVSVRLLPD